MILLIDNYDSFSYNIYQLAGSIDPHIQVIRNDEMTPEQIEALQPDAVILSPGPGRPEHAGVCESLIREAGGRIPILGICLGHQAICQVYGGTITYAERLMHGKQSEIITNPDSILFRQMETSMPAARYHSLAVSRFSVPDCLRITAVTRDGEVMAVEHRQYPVFGVQFHPESILTPNGRQILENFYTLAVSAGKERVLL